MYSREHISSITELKANVYNACIQENTFCPTKCVLLNTYIIYICFKLNLSTKCVLLNSSIAYICFKLCLSTKCVLHISVDKPSLKQMYIMHVFKRTHFVDTQSLKQMYIMHVFKRTHFVNKPNLKQMYLMNSAY
jgi:hypothetical protein